MARSIDFENLDEDDIQYLRQRHALVTEAELLGYKDIRKTVDEWQPAEEEEYDAQQDVIPAPQTTGDAVVPTIPTNDGSEEEEDTPPYSEWSKDELSAELKERGLAVSGTKDELVARLEADDEEEEEDETP